MRQRRKIYRATTALLLAAWAPWTVQAADRLRPEPCPLEIVGTWKAVAAEPRLLSFSSNGWANVLGSAEEQQPSALDILAQVQYELLPRRSPRSIAFQTRRGNDIFPAGNSRWEITTYTDESFSARASTAEAGEQSHWSRVQTHRYFLTLAARGDSTLFVMWTTLDGTAAIEALGTTTHGAETRFGRIPQQLTKAFTTQSDRPDDAMIRVELSEAEYLRTRPVFVSWDTLVRQDQLAREDPLRQAVLLLDATLQNVNRCGVKIRTVGEPTASLSTPRPLALIRSLRKTNERVHVPDKAFPVRWQPPPVL